MFKRILLGIGVFGLVFSLVVWGGEITRTTTLPDSANKADFYSLVDDADVTAIKDADEDTKVDTEETADEDRIRLDIGGTQIVLFADGTNAQTINVTHVGAAGGFLLDIDDFRASYGQYITSAAEKSALAIVGEVALAEPLVDINSAVVQTGAALLKVKNDSESSTATTAHFESDGTNAAGSATVLIQGDGGGNVLYIDQNGGTTAIRCDGCTAVLGSTTTTPTLTATDKIGNAASDGWIKVQLDGSTDAYIPYWN